MKYTWQYSNHPLSPEKFRSRLPGASRSSVPLGWTGIHVEHVPLMNGGELVVPPLSHHHVVLMGRGFPGRVSQRCEDVKYEGDSLPGGVGVIPAGAARYCRFEKSGSWTFAQIDPGLVVRVAAESCGIDFARLVPRPLFHDPWQPVASAMAALRDEIQSGGAGGRLLGDALANIIAVHLIRRSASSKAAREAERGAEGRLSASALRSVVEYIMDDLGGDLALADLAAAAGLSAYHFARRFRATTGQTPHQYVIERRVERAKELLAGGMPPAQVAEAVGFADQSHLIRHFRRIVGVTPSKFA